jgi:branched-chain amino acid transport system ATP-binding protein
MTSLLKLSHVDACYGKSQILFGMDMTLYKGEIATLLGRNGMGKTTTVKTIVGMVQASAGRITFDGHETTSMPMFKVASLGVGLVPEGRRIFPNLTVLENLQVAAKRRANGSSEWDAERVFEMFPRLRERMRNYGGQLSGGEQQMLAIGRALTTNPSLLILDEATEGLAPLIRDEIWASLAKLKRSGQTILVIDKDLKKLLPLSDRNYVIERGRVVWHGSSSELQERKDIAERYIGI